MLSLLDRKELFMENKDVYTLQELFENLPVSLSELARQSRMNEVTLARIRDGKHTTRRDTANRLLLAMSKIYERPLSLRNVTGIHLQGQEQPEESVA
jgi:predicted transcriptional regulator